MNQAPTTSGASELESLDAKIAEAVKKMDALKHEKQRKDAELAKLDKAIADLSQEESSLAKAANGETPEAQKLRTLENNLDKASLKIQEAVHIGGAYQAIIGKLQQVRTKNCIHMKCSVIDRVTGAPAVRRQD